MTVKIFYWNEEKEDFDRRRCNQVETAEYNAKWSKLWLTFLTKREPMCLHIDKNVRRITAGKQVLYQSMI